MFIYVIIFLFLALFIFLLIYLNHKDKKEGPTTAQPNDGCCGAHEVCERESLLNQGNKIEYYDDEELDTLAGIDSNNYTNEQVNLISEVFYTLNEKDVAGWLRSLQLRQIELPQEIKDAALLIVRERREK